MFISEQFAFLELHKTGCTHIRSVLKDLLEGELVGAHNQATSEMFTETRKFLGSIRDPWEWYLSLWAYGCDKKGGVFYATTQSENSLAWRDTYDDISDARAFREWLYMMNDASFLADLGEGYSNCQVSRTTGFMTYRYLVLFCTKQGRRENLNRLSTFEQVKAYDENNCFIDYFIRNENLESDLFRGIETYGAVVSDAKKLDILSRPRSNTSPKRAPA
jgi:hypothetical protein